MLTSGGTAVHLNSGKRAEVEVTGTIAAPSARALADELTLHTLTVPAQK